jgi:hypothetical protein
VIAASRQTVTPTPEKSRAGVSRAVPAAITGRMGNVSHVRVRLLALMCGGLVPVGLAAPAAAAGPPGNNGS